jgi:hypothetical protein
MSERVSIAVSSMKKVTSFVECIFVVRAKQSTEL